MDSAAINEIDRQLISISEMESLAAGLNSLKYDMAFSNLRKCDDKEQLQALIDNNEKMVSIIKDMYIRQSALNKAIQESISAG